MDSSTNNLRYDGENGAVFWMALWGAILTVLTLGIYGFWLRTKLRRYHWSKFQVGGTPLEYTGRGLELLIGALVAIVIIVVYVVVVAILLNFAGLSFAPTAAGASGASALLVLAGIPLIPLYPYAYYRAIRYVLSRTNWRGIRFSLDLAAWSYAFRAIGWGILQIITLGLITPVADYWKAKYIVDRARFGDQAFRLEGSAGGMYKGFLPLLLGVFIFIGLGAYVFTSLPPGGFQPGDPLPLSPGLIALGVIAYILAIFGYIWYRCFTVAYVVRNMRIGDAGVDNTLTAGRVFGHVVVMALALMGIMLLLALAFGAVLFAIAGGGLDIRPTPGGGVDVSNVPPGVLIAFGVAYIIFVGAFVGVIRGSYEAFYTTALYRSIATRGSIANIAALEAASQTSAEAERSGEGFAAVLDVSPF